MKNRLHILGLILILFGTIVSCSKGGDNDTPYSATLTALPTQASAGNVIKIYGGILNSGTTGASVTIDGKEADIVNSSNNAIYVQIPQNANTGQVVVTINGSTAGITAGGFSIVPNRVFVVASSDESGTITRGLYELSLSDYSLSLLQSLGTESCNLFSIPWTRTVVAAHATWFKNYEIDTKQYNTFTNTTELVPPFVSFSATQTLYYFSGVSTSTVGAYTINPATMTASTSPQFDLETDASVVSGIEILDDAEMAIFLNNETSNAFALIEASGNIENTKNISQSMDGNLTVNPFGDDVYALVGQNIVQLNTETGEITTVYEGGITTGIMLTGLTYVNSLNSVVATANKGRENVLVIYNVSTGNTEVKPISTSASIEDIIAL
ncbi:MAG: IPT/TIG domain-containing protein [Marinifilaceae bacterium]